MLPPQRSDLRQADQDGNLPIHIAAREGQGHMTWEMFTILGIPVLKKRNKAGYTLLDLIEQNSNP